MIQTIDIRDKQLSFSELLKTVPRAKIDLKEALKTVSPIMLDVQERGEAALREQAMRFDGVANHALRVSESDINSALAKADKDLVAALKKMIERVRLASAAQVPAPQQTQLPGGGLVQLRYQPVRRVGLYVPGGKAVYPSSVIMNAIPALVAGVQSLAIASPAQRDSGGVHPTILTAAALCGVTEVYAIGGAGAIAALAYGVPELGLEPVDTVTGPGNIYVAAAKRAISGIVGIDSEAGTTEIMIVADKTANPVFVAADLISQAEHDEAAAAVLVTDSPELVYSVTAQISEQLLLADRANTIKESLAGPQSAIILVKDMTQAAQVADAYAAEHLEIHTADAADLGAKISNAGAIFIGSNSPVSLGDYMAGSNHVLPTGGTARFASGLGAHTFLRPQQIVTYSRDDLCGVSDPITAIAMSEGLSAHAAAVQIRLADQ